MKPMQYDFFLAFILAHLTGDFVLQTNKLARLKSEGTKGLLLHSGIVCAMQVLFMSFFGSYGVLAALAAGLIHYYIDYTKNKLSKYFGRLQLLLFLLDQAAHIGLIGLLSVAFQHEGSYIPDILRPEYLRGAIELVIVLFAATIAAKLLQRDIKPPAKRTEFFKPRERGFDMVTAMALWAAWYLPPLWAMAAVLAVFFTYSKQQWDSFQNDFDTSILKFLILALSTYGVILWGLV